MQPPHEISEEKVLMLDNGFVHLLLAGAFDEALKNEEGDLRSVLQPPCSPWRTPFAFMEWIGVSGKKIATPPEFVPDDPVTVDTVFKALEHFLAHYSNCPELEQQELQQKWEAQDARMDRWAQQFWKPMTKGTLDGRETADWLQTALALDAVHKLDLPPAVGRDYYSQLFATSFFNDDRLIRNLSKFRLAKRLWDRTWNKLTQGEEPPPGLVDAHAAMSIKSKQDYLDCDLIHTAVLGVETEDGKRHRVTCLTCDDPDALLTRLGVYRGLLAYARKLHDQEAAALGYPADYDSCMNGHVYCFDHSGTLVRKIDVLNDTDALQFMGKPPETPEDGSAEHATE